MSLEQAFEEFKKLPDWDRFPMPEVFYEHFKVKKPQSLSVNECATYIPPPYASLGNGKVEIRGPLPGGVREIKDLQQLPVDVKLLTDEGELKEYPPIDPDKHQWAKLMEHSLDVKNTPFHFDWTKLTKKNASDTPINYLLNSLTLPKEDSKKETQHE